MCLKEKDNETDDKKYLLDEAIIEAKDLLNIAKEARLKENLTEYEVVRQQGIYNMLDPRARQLTRLSEKTYKYIQDNYEELIKKYPEVRTRAKMQLDYMKSAEIAKLIALKGCENCREIVSRELDITENDLCDECKKIIAEHNLWGNI